MDVMTESMRRILDRQLDRWASLESDRPCHKAPGVKVICVSRQPGSGGKLVAAKVALALGLKYHDRELIQKVAERSKAEQAAVESRDERGHSMFEGWMDALVRQRGLLPERYLRHLHLFPDEYLDSLMAVISDIAEGDGGIIVGRGAHFVIPPADCFRVRIVAPLEERVRNLAHLLDLSSTRARMLVMRRDADRKAFARFYFQQDIADPENYDLVVNTGTFDLGQAADAVVAGFRRVTGD